MTESVAAFDVTEATSTDVLESELPVLIDFCGMCVPCK
jgi:hypothetical protein